jgi:PKD repeat protein
LPTLFHYNPIGTPLGNAGYQWDFGDNTVAFNSSPTHVYPNPGTYGISLTVTDLNSVCSTTVLDTIIVSPIPVAHFNRDSACVNTAVPLFDLSTLSSGSINSWNWTFGTHGNSNVQNPIFTLSVADSVPVKLVVQSIAGCKDSITKYVSIYPLPIVSFTPSVTYGGPPLPVIFTNLSNAVTYSWNFGDSSSLVTLTNPVHTFADTGIFNIVLTGSSAYGCTNSANQTVYVLKPNLDLAIENLSFTEENNLWQIKARVRNEGNIDISSFEINSKLDGKSLVNELFDRDTIFAGRSMDVLFKSRFTVDFNENPGYLCLEITSVNDTLDYDLSDNQKCITTGKDFQVFEVYPNPFIDNINLGLNIPIEGNVSVSLYNVAGEKMKATELKHLLKGYNSILIDGSGLEAGVYITEIEFNDTTIMKKLIRYRN